MNFAVGLSESESGQLALSAASVQHLRLLPFLFGREENAVLAGVGVQSPREVSLPVKLEVAGPGKDHAVWRFGTDGVRRGRGHSAGLGSLIGRDGRHGTLRERGNGQARCLATGRFRGRIGVYLGKVGFHRLRFVGAGVHRKYLTVSSCPGSIVACVAQVKKPGYDQNCRDDQNTSCHSRLYSTLGSAACSLEVRIYMIPMRHDT